MGDLLATLGSKFAERWFALLVLPGALFVSAAATAHVLGQSHALDLARLVRQVQHWTTTAKAGGFGGLAVALLAFLLASAAAGLAAQALGSTYERIALASHWEHWPTPLRLVAQRCVDTRRTRWERQRVAYTQELDEAARRAVQAALHGHHGDPWQREPVERDLLLDAAYQRVVRISEFAPQCPTWIGDRIRAVTVRLDHAYRLDLGVVWPSLWVTLPEVERTEINSAREAQSRATALVGWGLIYVALTVVWWPGFVIAGVTVIIAWRRSRDAVETYAQLVEACAQLHVLALARQLGVGSATDESLTSAIGWDLTRRLQGRDQGNLSTGTAALGVAPSPGSRPAP